MRPAPLEASWRRRRRATPPVRRAAGLPAQAAVVLEDAENPFGRDRPGAPPASLRSARMWARRWRGCSRRRPSLPAWGCAAGAPPACSLQRWSGTGCAVVFEARTRAHGAWRGSEALPASPRAAKARWIAAASSGWRGSPSWRRGPDRDAQAERTETQAIAPPSRWPRRGGRLRCWGPPSGWCGSQAGARRAARTAGRAPAARAPNGQVLRRSNPAAHRLAARQGSRARPSRPRGGPFVCHSVARGRALLRCHGPSPTALQVRNLYGDAGRREMGLTYSFDAQPGSVSQCRRVQLPLLPTLADLVAVGLVSHEAMVSRRREGALRLARRADLAHRAISPTRSKAGLGHSAARCGGPAGGLGRAIEAALAGGARARDAAWVSAETRCCLECCAGAPLWVDQPLRPRAAPPVAGAGRAERPRRAGAHSRRFATATAPGSPPTDAPGRWRSGSGGDRDWPGRSPGCRRGARRRHPRPAGRRWGGGAAAARAPSSGRVARPTSPARTSWLAGWPSSPSSPSAPSCSPGERARDHPGGVPRPARAAGGGAAPAPSRDELTLPPSPSTAERAAVRAEPARRAAPAGLGGRRGALEDFLRALTGKRPSPRRTGAGGTGAVLPFRAGEREPANDLAGCPGRPGADLGAERAGIAPPRRARLPRSEESRPGSAARPAGAGRRPGSPPRAPTPPPDIGGGLDSPPGRG